MRIQSVWLAQEGGEEHAQEAPNPILPEMNEIIWGTLAFLILFAVMAKFAYPAIKKAMEDRSAKIQGDIDAAETARSDAERELEEYRAQLASARDESNRILDEARQQAEALRADQRSRVDAELAELRAQAQADIELAKDRALADLHTHVSELAIGAAETIVERTIDRQIGKELVESYIRQVGSSS